MDKTPFAGLTVLEPDESLSEDGASFQAINPVIVDRLVELGAVTHRHDAHAALPDPSLPPSAAIVPTGGALPADLALYFGFTLVDTDAGETLLSPAVSVSTGPAFDSPATPPTAEIAYDDGTLLTDTYYYAITLLDGLGGETPPSPWAMVEREPGFASGRVLLSNLRADFDANDAVAWRLYRATAGSTFNLMAEGSTDTFTDDGLDCLNCDQHPPNEFENNTNQASKAVVTLPDDPAMSHARAAAIRVYSSIDGEFLTPSLVGDFPLSSAGQALEVTNLNFGRGAPPDVSTALPGASQIDPDTDLLDWHWKRPVTDAALLGSGAPGDVRLEHPAGKVWAVLGSAGAADPDGWTWINSGAAGGGGSIRQVAASGDGSVLNPEAIAFVGEGLGVDVAEAGGSAVVTITDVGLEVSDEDGPTVGDISGLQFLASAGAIVGVEDNGDGTANVVIAASGIQGPPGEPGNDGAEGPPGTVLDLADNDGPLIEQIRYLEFVGSGGTGVSVADLGGGSARVLVSGGGGGGVSPTALLLPWDDDFTTDLSAYEDFPVGGWQNDFAIVGGKAVPQSVGTHGMYLDSERPLLNGVVVIEVLVGTAGSVIIAGRWIGLDPQRLFFGRTSDSGSLYINETIDGSDSQVAASTGGEALVQDNRRWLLAGFSGQHMHASWWDADPMDPATDISDHRLQNCSGESGNYASLRPGVVGFVVANTTGTWSLESFRIFPG